MNREGGKWWESKSLKGKPPVGVQAKECKGHREHAQKRLGLQQWRPLAVVCACVLFAGACLCAYASVCVCLVNCALTTCLVKASFNNPHIRKTRLAVKMSWEG